MDQAQVQLRFTIRGVLRERQLKLEPGALELGEAVGHETRKPGGIGIHRVGSLGLTHMPVGILETAKLELGERQPEVCVAYEPSPEIDQPLRRNKSLLIAARIVEGSGVVQKGFALPRFNIEGPSDIRGGPVVFLQRETGGAQGGPRGGHARNTVRGAQKRPLRRNQLPLQKPPLAEEVVRLVIPGLGLEQTLENVAVARNSVDSSPSTPSSTR